MDAETTGVWLDAERACDVKVLILPSSSHEQGKAPASSAVYAPSSLLCTIPYFQAALSEPWQNESAPTASALREITLECADSISPSDYQNCLCFLVPHEPAQHMTSVDAILRLLHAADHLLYQDCADICMAFLASFPCSDKEEEIIQQTISNMGLKPSSDLTAKLASADDIKVFMEVLVLLAAKAGSTETNFALRDFVQATMNEAPHEAASVCLAVILNAWTTATNDLMNANHGFDVVLAHWIALTKLLLEYGDVQKLLEAFVRDSKKLCNATLHSRSSGLAEVLRLLFLRAIPSKSNNKLVLLSNFDRGTLLAAWAPMVGSLNSVPLESAFTQLFTTLPLQDPIIVALVKERVYSPFFTACYRWWRSKLFERMKRCAVVHEEIDLEASSSTKLTSAEKHAS